MLRALKTGIPSPPPPPNSRGGGGRGQPFRLPTPTHIGSALEASGSSQGNPHACSKLWTAKGLCAFVDSKLTTTTHGAPTLTTAACCVVTDSPPNSRLKNFQEQIPCKTAEQPPYGLLSDYGYMDTYLSHLPTTDLLTPSSAAIALKLKPVAAIILALACLSSYARPFAKPPMRPR